MRARAIGALLIALTAASAAATPAGARVVDSPAGPIGYLPLNEAAAPAHAPAGSSPSVAAEPKGATGGGAPPLEYHGGPVMHSQTSYAIFWEPTGYSFPAGYVEGIETYLQNVAADSGKPTNVYSVSAQYTDGSGHAAYSDSFGGSVVDTDPYPTTGTCPTYKAAETFTACISDGKLESQVEQVVAAKGWPVGLSAEYYVVLPPKAGSCFEQAGKVCFDKQFCAYHSYAEPAEGPYEIYANISYSAADPGGCGVPELPNGLVDHSLSSLSHEANESITDPTLEAWFDEEGEEDGDKCRNTANDYGPALGGASGALFNEEIGAGRYYLQREWSNDIGGCAQRVSAAAPVIASPEEAAPGESVPFDGAGSVPGAGGIVSYAWDFGDGDGEAGPTASHTYSSPGVYTVTLTVEDDGGFTYSTSEELTVAPNPQRKLTVVPLGSGSGTVTDSGGELSCPPTCMHRYANGSSVTLTATPSPGSVFSGWSGGGCGGTGSCELTMSADREVRATFAALPPPGGGSTPAASATPGAAPAPAPAPALAHGHRAPRCHRGFRRARRRGKAVCVKVKGRRKHRWAGSRA